MPSPVVTVTAERVIEARPPEVAAVMFDPRRYPEWMQAVTDVHVLDPDAPYDRGSRVELHARFLGRTISWTTEVIELETPHRLRLRIPSGALRGEVLYEIEPRGEASLTRITNSGEARAYRWLPRVIVEAAMKPALGKDLDRLASIVDR